MKLNYFQDPGHGWIGVKRSLVQELGIEDKISSCSYQRGQSVYLEEDCDASLLIEALKAKGIEFELVSKHTDKRHPIRSYESFKWVLKLGESMIQISCGNNQIKTHAFNLPFARA